MLTQGEDVEVHALASRGWSVSAIARHLGRDRKTVRAYLTGKRQPRRRAAARPDPLARFVPYLVARFADDPHIWATALFDEVTPLGYGCRRARAAARLAAAQDRQAPAAPIGWHRPQYGHSPSGWPQRNSRHALHNPLVSLVRSPQSRQAPMVSYNLAWQVRQRPAHSRVTCLPQSAQAPAGAAARRLHRSHRSPKYTGRSSPQPEQRIIRVRDSR
jgi:hypothetical protein